MRFLIGFIFAVISMTTNANINPHKIIHIKESDGLGKVVVYDIAEDKTGFIWLGTNTGIVRYDGNEFVSYDSHNIDGGIVRAITTDGNGGIWASSDLGVSYKAANKESFISSAITSPTNDAVLEIRTILPTKNGAIVGTNEGVFETNKGLSNFKPLGLHDCQAVAIKNTALGITIAANCGLYTYSDSKFHLVNLAETNKKQPITMRIENTEDKILIGTYDKGLFLLNNLGEVEHTYTSDNALNENLIYGVMVDNKQRIWVGYDSKGVQVFDRKFNELARFNKDNSGSSISDDAIENIFQSSNGDVWIGTTYGGLNVYRTKNESISTLNSSKQADYQLSGDAIRAVNAAPDGNVWLGVHGNQFSVFNLDTKKVTSVTNNLMGKHSKYFIFDDEYYWVFDEKGFSKLSHQMDVLDTFTQENSTIPGGLIDSAAKLNSDTFALSHWWIGVTIFDTSNNTAKNYQTNNSNLPSNDTLGTLLNNDDLWVITKGGLSKLNLKSELITNFTFEHLGGYAYPNHMTRDGQHLLIATSRGLTAFSLNDEKFDRSVIPEKLLKLSHTRAIIINDAGYWVSTSKGLYTLQQGILTKLNESHGLADEDFIEASASKVNESLVAFGAVGGASIIDTQSLELPIKKDIITEVTAIETNGHTSTMYTIGDKLNLPQNTKLIQLKMSELTFREPTSIYTAQSDNGEYHYSNGAISIPVTYGDNSLVILNGDKIVSRLSINNPTPLFASWYAWIIYTLLLMMVAYLIGKARTNKLRRQSEQLEHTVQTRTHELEESRQNAISQAHQIETYAKERQSLFENVSHELRTPLTLILGPIGQLYKSPNLSVDESNKAKLVLRNAERLNRLVNQILDLSRVSHRTKQTKISNFSGITKSVVENFSSYCIEKALKVNLDITDGIHVSVSKPNLELLIGNLLSNAIKYNRPNGVIFVQLISRNNEALLSIEDSGIGIPKEHQSKIFERFYRVNAEQSENIEGSGIGLSIVRQLVEESDGTVTLESSPSKGTKFQISLPLHHIEIVKLEEDSKPEQSTPIEGRSNKTNKKTLLLMDDNSDLREYLTSIFDKQYLIHTATNGIEGLEKAHKYIPDLIISDVMMPELDGMGFLQKAKSNDLLNHIPILLLTAKGSNASKIEGLTLRADDYIAKPFNEDELFLKVKNLLEARELYRTKVEMQLLGKADEPFEQTSFISKLDKIIGEHYTDPEFSVSILAKEIAIGERQLLRKLKSETNLGPKEYIKAFRLRQAAELLQAGNTASMVANLVGFNSLSHFSSSFKAQYGCSPSEFKQQQLAL